MPWLTCLSDEFLLPPLRSGLVRLGSESSVKTWLFGGDGLVVTKLYRCDELAERGDISIGKTGDVDTGYASVGMGGRPRSGGGCNHFCALGDSDEDFGDEVTLFIGGPTENVDESWAGDSAKVGSMSAN